MPRLQISQENFHEQPQNREIHESFPLYGTLMQQDRKFGLVDFVWGPTC